jgi:hypothetical protein
MKTQVRTDRSQLNIKGVSQVLKHYVAFYRQSLQIQQLLAELFHNAYALRGVDRPEDVQSMHPQQRQLAIDSLDLAQQALTICVGSSSYREGMKYGKCFMLLLEANS